MNKISANLFYVRDDGLLFVQLKKNYLLDRPNLESYFGRIVIQFHGMKIEADCIAITKTGIILDDWQIVKTAASTAKTIIIN